jgi:hypothetical protein
MTEAAGPETTGFSSGLSTMATLNAFTLALSPKNRLLAERLFFLNTAARLYPDLIAELRAVFDNHPQAWIRPFFLAFAAHDDFDAAWSQMSADERAQWQSAWEANQPLPPIKMQSAAPSTAALGSPEEEIPSWNARPSGWFAAFRALLLWAREWRIDKERWILHLALDTLRSWQEQPDCSRNKWAVNDMRRGPTFEGTEARIPINDYDPFLETPYEAIERLKRELRTFLKNLGPYVRERQAVVENVGTGRPRKRAPEHFEWAVHYIFGKMSFREITTLAGQKRPGTDISDEAVRLGVRDIMQRIGLQEPS